MDEDNRFNIYIGCWIKQLRCLHGMSKIQFSEKIDVNVQDMLMYESGLKSIPVHVFFRISQMFNVSINDILSDYYVELKKDNRFIRKLQ
ncbi:TPA: helix-turn-helix transcriptional regulator [Morganella morganii]|nr:helix-turn-helix transcriptional regulator [Morganella morganii]